MMENKLVVKSNDLIQARYDLTLNQQKVILYAASKLDRDNKEFDIIELDIQEFNNLLNIKGNRYEELREVVRELRKKEIIIQTDDKEFITGWLSSITFHKNIGKISLKFDDGLIPYLLQLKEQFTRYQIKNILYLSNKHSIRIYELLKQYETIGKRTFTVEDIKKLLLLENQYDRFHDFERFVLKTTMEEINEYTDIIISYKKIKKGRAIDSIQYTIKAKKNNDYIKYLEETYNIKDIRTDTGLEDENFNTEQLVKIYEKAINKLGTLAEDKISICSYININYKAMLDKDNVINPFTYLMDMLEHDRASAIVYIKAYKKAN